MKATSILRAFLLGSASLLGITATHSATLYWDGGTTDIGTDGNGLSGGTTGDWNNVLLNWDQGANLAHVAWSGTTNTAVFGNTGVTGNTVTLTDNITVGGLRFYSSTYTVSTGANTLNLGGANNTIALFGTSGTTASATITGTVAGTGNVILTSANPFVSATLTLNSTGTGWSGGTTVNPGGILSLANTSNALVNTSGITINGGTVTFAKNGSIGDQVGDTAAITINGGGTLSQSNSTAGPHTETVGAITLATGQANIGITNGASSGGVVTTLTSLARSANTAAFALFSANTAQANLQVTGASDTAANQIIGPWATFGTSATVQNDYAIYTGGNGTLAAANIAGSAETDWTTATDSYTLNTGALTTLTGTRTINSLKFIGATSNLDLDNFNLQTFGVLWGGANANKNIIAGGTGSLTTPTGGGNLFLTAGQNVSHTVSAPITNNSGNVTVVKSGVGTLVLSGTNTYSGGTVINAGTLSIGNVDHIGGATANLVFGGTGTLTATAALDFSSGGTLTVNQGAVATFTGNAAVKFASASGSGTLLANPSGNANFVDLGDASGFTGNLVARLTGNHNIGNTSNNQIQFTKLADTAGSLIQFVGGTSDSQQDIRVALYGNGGQLTFNNRQIQILPRTASNWNIEDNTLVNNNGNAAHTWVINTDLLMTSTSSTGGAARYLTLSGSNTGDNAFNGLLPDGDNGNHPLGLRKTGSGKWIVSANNSFTGPVSVTAGTLVLSGTNQFTGSTTATSGGTLSVNSVSNYGVASAIGAASSGAIILGSGSGQTGTLEYTGSGHSMDRQIQIGSIGAASGNAVILGNGTGALTLTAATLNVSDPTTGGSSGSRNLTLGGDYTGGVNEIQGAIVANAEPTRDVAIIKNGSGSWKLGGANTYTAATTVSGGTLILSGSNSSAGNTTVTTGTLQLDSNSNGGLASGNLNLNNNAAVVQAINADRSISNNGIMNANPTFSGDYSISMGNLRVNNGARTVTNNITSGKSLTVASIDRDGSNNRNLTVDGTGATIVSGAVTLSAGTLTKNGSGTLTLGGANDYTGATIINAGVLALNGATQATTGITFTGGSLGLDIANTVAAASAAVNLTGGSVLVTGSPTLTSYTLLTAASITGTPTLASPVPGYELQLANSDTELRLVQTGAPTGYAAWQAANGTAGDRSADHDNDGVDNGTEHFLGGTANTTGFTALPGVTNTLGTLSVTWTKAATYGGTYGIDFVVQTSDTLTGTWNTEASPGTVSISGNNVTYTFPNPLGTRKFARLVVTGP